MRKEAYMRVQSSTSFGDRSFMVGFRRLFDVLISASLVATLVLVSGCSSEDGYRHYANAVGPDLYSPQTARNTRLLSSYTGSLCAQAGLSSGQGCRLDTTAEYAIFVQMGLYDIDQRCDAFLDTLYYKEKTEGPILEQIAATNTLTRGVMTAAGTSIASFQIVAAAFDFAASSFRNSRKGLLEALDPTTVKAIVFRRQKEIKQEIAGHQISSMPEALHAMRAYLRVCMPFAIEMEANAALTTLQWTDGPGRSPVGFQDSRIAEIPTTDSRVGGGGRGIPGDVVKITGGLTDAERDIPQSLGRRIQAMLCVVPPDGNFTASTRIQMKEFEKGLRFTKSEEPGDAEAKIDNRAEFRDYKNAADVLGDCNKLKHRSAFEAGFFSNRESFHSIESDLVCVLSKSQDPAIKERFAKLDRQALKQGTIGVAQREAITLIGMKYGSSNGVLTPDIIDRVVAEADCDG